MVRDYAVKMLAPVTDVSSKKNPGKDHKAFLAYVEGLKVSNATVYKKIMEGKGPVDSESVGGGGKSSLGPPASRITAKRAMVPPGTCSATGGGVSSAGLLLCR